MKTVGEEQLLAFLKARRRTLVQAVVDRSRAYDDRDVRKLAELQGAITAIEDVITDEKSEELAEYVAVYPAMGPGGILYRFGAGSPWSSLLAASATGPEQLLWPERWSVGQGQGGPGDRPFLGSNLTVRVVA